MAENNNILNRLNELKKNEQFKMPEGYFDKLPGAIMNRIREQEKTSVDIESKTSVFSLVKNQLAIAVSFAALFIIAYTSIKIIVPDSENNIPPETEIYASLQADISELDEEYLYNLAYNESTETIIDKEFTDNEIIDYLIEEDVDPELTPDF